MSLAKDIIKKAVSDYKANKSKNRRNHVNRLIDYYTSSGTNKYIERFFSPDIYNDVPLYTINITKWKEFPLCCFFDNSFKWKIIYKFKFSFFI